ncbi:MAG TPA: aquaporin, partial [Nitrososphaeraceae archaeon]|nr:aquaporin [Nitrososphaeraceae archaeon]
MSQLWKLSNRLSSNQKIFFAELLGTFLVIVFATGSVVLDAKLNGALGLPFIAIAPAIAVAVGVYLFGKISMAHFNPAVTVGFLITNHFGRKKGLLMVYLLAEIIGGILASIFIYFFIGQEANLGANAPNYTNYPVYVIVGIEILASALLMLVILIVVYTKGLKKFGGLAIGAIVGLDIFLFGLISGASMNPARSLAPAVVSGYYANIWLYITAPFIGTTILGLLLRNKFYK